LILPVVICLSQRLSHACLSSGLFGGETANGSIHQLWFTRPCLSTWITVGILELIHAISLQLPATGGGALLLDRNQPGRSFASGPVSGLSGGLVTLNNHKPIAWPWAGDVSFKCLPHQLSTVGYVPTVVLTGNGESGFDSGEGA